MKSLKKISVAVMLLGLMFILMIGLGTTASAATYGDMEYEISNGEVTITGCDWLARGEIVIPETIEGCPVTVIGEMAFYACKNITSIIIPNSVTTISDTAFYCCSGIKNITIPESVITIGYYAFNACRNLLSVTIPKNVTTIDFAAFAYCSSLKNITIPDSVTKIGDYVFQNCTSLETVTIGNGITTISKDAFYDCTSLTDITFGNNVEIIEERVFYNCDSLSGITLPDSITSIGDYVFQDCSNLKNVRIGNGVTSIGAHAFESCSSLENITIPESVTSIGYEAFYACDSLERITILNPYCEIYDSYYTFDSNATIYGYSNSTAQAYAEKYGCEFVDIGQEHNYTSKVTAPTCTEKGYTTYTCDCGDSYKSDYVNAKGHKGGTATCKAKAKCTVCGTSYGSLASHNYSAATCTKAKTCKTCGATSGKAKGHDYAAATCTKAKTCKVCGATSGKENGHTYAAATCTKPKTCTVCKATSGKANGHKYTNACDTSCNTCKATRKITHSYKNVVTKSTLTKSGKVENKCSVCGKVSKTTTVYYPKTIALSATKFTYNGSVKGPGVTVKNSQGKALVKGTDYTVKYSDGRKNVGKYTVTVTFKGNYSGTKTLSFYILPGKTSKITPAATTTTLKATWNKVTGATGYKVELLNASGKVVKSATTTKLTYTFSKLTAGTTYKVKVTAYKTISNKNQYSTVSTTLTTATKPATPTLKVASAKKGIANLSWSNVAGETGYQIYYSTSKNGTYTKAGVYNANTVKGSKSKLTSGKTYYFKVRAYKKVGSTTVYGAWSSVKSVKIK